MDSHSTKLDDFTKKHLRKWCEQRDQLRADEVEEDIMNFLDSESEGMLVYWFSRGWTLVYDAAQEWKKKQQEKGPRFNTQGVASGRTKET